MTRKNSKTQSVEEVVAEQLADLATLTIPQAALALGLSEHYVRKAVRSGKLPTTKVATTADGKTWRHEITREALEAWRNTSVTRTREDGRNKFVVYMSPEEVEKLLKVIGGEDYAATLKRANLKTAPVSES